MKECLVLRKMRKMKIRTINTGYFKLDGGAMFGIVPKQLWERKCPPDELNRCTWAMRCLLVEQGDRKVLIDTGLGNKQDEKFRKHFDPHGEDSLIHSLAQAGVVAEEITDVLLTHLHFDHVGGAVKYDEKGKLVTTFPNATYWSNEVHYKWAMQPNPREKASFLKENIVPIKESGQLQFIDVQRDELKWMDNISLQYVYGHTEAMTTVKFKTAQGTFVYCADLLASSAHIPMPYVMGYDLRPLNTMEEKGKLLNEALADDFYLIFEHDKMVECCTVEKNERGRIVMKDQLLLKDKFGL